MAVYLIHKRPDLIDECCDLINSEWPRSKTARLINYYYKKLLLLILKMLND